MKGIMKWFLMLAVTVILAGFAGDSVYAQDQNVLTIIKMVTTTEAVEALKEPKDTAEVFERFEAGSDLLVVEVVDDVWYCITYKGEIAYVKSALTVDKVIYSEEQAAVDEEFEEVGYESTVLAEAIEKEEKDSRRTLIFGGTIAVLIIAIIGVGILAKINEDKNKDADADEEADADAGKNESNEG